jgi:hypothetical protein
MALIYEQGFNVKRGQEEAFQRWTTENDAGLKGGAPQGVEYLGTYIVSMSSEKHTGEYRVLWRLDSYGTLDTIEEATRDEKSDWGRLNREVTEFLDIPIGAEYSFAIYRPLVGAVLWDVS